MDTFRQIYETHAALVRRVIFRVAPDCDLDEAVQECFLKIHRALPDFAGQADLRTWIYRIAMNHGLDVRRALKRRAGRVDFDLDRVPDSHALPLDAGLVSRALTDAVASLESPFRETFVLCALEELSAKEAAQILHTTEGTIKSRLHRARTTLMDILRKRGISYDA